MFRLLFVNVDVQFPAPFRENRPFAIVFSLLCCRRPAACIQAGLWPGSPLQPLLCSPSLSLLQGGLGDCGCTVGLEGGWCQSSKWFFLVFLKKYCAAYSGLLPLHINLRIS